MGAPFTPGDFPPNAPERPGYRLEFHDEFDGASLDRRKWLPFYLPQWSSRARSAPRYRLEEGTLVLMIEADQEPWCPEFDGENRCSSLQTGVFAGPPGSPVGQHRFNPGCVVREPQENVRTYTPRFGYFELRARVDNAPTSLAALWMIGYEDRPERSGEVAVVELFGKGMHAEVSQVRYGIHPWGDPTLTDEFYAEPLPLDATRYHLYAAEWTPTHVDFYVDNVKLRTIEQSPQYEMQFMLGIYDLPNSDEGEGPQRSGGYPRRFTIDYFRAFQPLRGYAGSR